MFNSELIIQQNTVIQSLISILNYNNFLKRKKQLQMELDLSKMQANSNEFEAKTDLMKKLSKIIRENKKKLKYQEEDLLNIKNKRDQINNSIEDLTFNINELNKKKKECFGEINRITRDMDEDNQNNKKLNLETSPNDKKNLTNSEKIKILQNKARDFQYQIKKLGTKMNNSQLKFKEINPKYEKLKNGYNSLFKIINNDKKNLNHIQKELGDKYINKEENNLEGLDIGELDYIKTTQEIEDEIQDISTKLSRLSKSNSFLNTKNPLNLVEILNNLRDIEKTLKDKTHTHTITYNNNEIVESINNFRKIQLFNQKFEVLLNKFLAEINLETRIQIVISNDYSNFSIETKFIRTNKESLNFKELTTPEKIFFVIVFYLSIQILLNFENIIFSNLFLPNFYNKRGSVFRTIRKIIPIFNKENELKKVSLIFIISNLELKKPIDNIKIIKIKQP